MTKSKTTVTLPLIEYENLITTAKALLNDELIGVEYYSDYYEDGHKLFRILNRDDEIKKLTEHILFLEKQFIESKPNDFHVPELKKTNKFLWIMFVLWIISLSVLIYNYLAI